MTIEATIQAPAVTTPTVANGTVPVPPRRRKNADVRTREHLTEAEVAALCKAARAKGRRYGARDATMILLCFRHAYRVSELLDLRWTDVDFKAARLNVRRLKGSISGVHPLKSDEVRALRALRACQPQAAFVFTSERGAPFSARGFHALLARIAERAGLAQLRVHPHALRHSTGYALVNRGTDTRTLQGYMGHAEIKNTVIYTALNATRFDDLWSK
jgi:type 1 fimbriae regulatory protein FimB/type 1 fimbriae regulatory protein FimE